MSQNNIFFQRNTLCHSLRIIVIPYILLSFFPDYCHSFRVIVIPSGLLSFLPDYYHSFRISVIPSELLTFQIFVILNSSSSLPYPKGEKNGHRRWPYMRISIKSNLTTFNFFTLRRSNSFIQPLLRTLRLFSGTILTQYQTWMTFTSSKTV